MENQPYLFENAPVLSVFAPDEEETTEVEPRDIISFLEEAHDPIVSARARAHSLMRQCGPHFTVRNGTGPDNAA